MTTNFTRDLATAEERGVVGRLSEGGWGYYHNAWCADAPHPGEPGVRDTIQAPWQYLGLHWQPCPRCRPPAAGLSAAA